MSELQYSTYPGWGEEALKNFHMSQAVRVPPGGTIHISGQGGWDPTTGEMRSDLAEEWRQAFDNVNLALTNAGGKGFSTVYKVIIYYTSDNEDISGLFQENFKRCFGDQGPAVTAIGVARLTLPGMRVEVDASAYIGE